MRAIRILVVQAEVVDISTDAPRGSDIFLVDTNVWFWTAYSKASLARGYRTNYDAYLKLALGAGARLYVCGLSQSELIHLIEKTERTLFNATLHPKDFRQNFPAERATVVSEASIAWGVVQNIAQIVDLHVDSTMTTRVLTRFQTCAMDGYDLISAEAMFEHGIPQIITDDGDFGCVAGVTLFTANQSVLRDATLQTKLLTR
jgi:predicted nucleic acid-binding protein